MAKLTAPLMSFKASGALAKTLVFFSWKGINVVRSYVIPANPQSADQTTQRGILEDAVDEWHLTKYTAADKTAWEKLAAILAKPMSGFNAFVKSWIDLKLADIPAVVVNPGFNGWIGGGGAGKFDATIYEDGEASACFFRWGYSKTALVNVQNGVEAPANNWTISGVSATVGQKVYCRMFPWLSDHAIGETGIYEFTIV